MEVFVYEYSCCQSVRDSTARALRDEGRAMLSAILDDLGRLPGVSTLTLLADDFGPAPFACRRISPLDEERVFRELAAAADYTLVIAPESDGLLHDRCRRVEEVGGHLLGPSSEAVRLTGDKLVLARHLLDNGIPTPPTFPLHEVARDDDRVTFPAVCKPRHGAGSRSMVLARDADDLRRLVSAESLIVQPFAPGIPASVAFLSGSRQCLALPPALQVLSDDGHFHYRGGRLPLAPSLAARAARIGLEAVQTVPGLRGYVGVDVVLGHPPDGTGDRVIEINPRLTTSYVGLRVHCCTNLAPAMLSVVRGDTVPELRWREERVSWTADGQVSVSPQPPLR